MKDTWTFQSNLTRRLLVWAVANLFGGGLLMVLRAQPFLQGFGSQAAGWGLVNALIALLGGRAAQNRRAALQNPHDPQIHARENQNLRRILWINAALDVGYMLGGITFAKKAQDNPQRRGMGWGIVFQGAFLFAFDVLNALSLWERDGVRENALSLPHPSPLPGGEGMRVRENALSLPHPSPLPGGEGMRVRENALSLPLSPLPEAVPFGDDKG